MMGYSFVHKPKGESYAAFFQREVFGEQWEIVESATIKRVFYAAARNVETGKVLAFVVTTSASPHDYCNFGYKVIEESHGPLQILAPARVLDALSPLEDLYEISEHESSAFRCAADWRAACRKVLAKPKVSKGDRVRFAENLTFNDGTVAREFIYSGRGGIFTLPGRDTRLRLGSWKLLNYEVIKEES